MAIYQTNLFVCEKCGHTETTSERVITNDDPPVLPPREGWQYISQESKGVLFCPECAAGFKVEQQRQEEKVKQVWTCKVCGKNCVWPVIGGSTDAKP